MTESIVGIVEEVINNGKAKGSGIRIAGKKYGVFDPAAQGMDDIQEGNQVSFRYKEKPSPDGSLIYKNIMGKITVTTGSAISPTTADAPAKPSTPARSYGGYSKGVFPVPALDGTRSIIRQNSITNAVNLTKGLVNAKTSLPAMARLVIETAMMFEAYSSGDLDAAEAEAAIAELEKVSSEDPAL